MSESIGRDRKPAKSGTGAVINNDSYSADILIGYMKDKIKTLDKALELVNQWESGESGVCPMPREDPEDGFCKSHCDNCEYNPETCVKDYFFQQAKEAAHE